MSKVLLFACLVLFGAVAVLGNTQIRFVNARYEPSLSFLMVASLEDYRNTTVSQEKQGRLDTFAGQPQLSIPATGYQDVPIYAYKVGEPITLYVVDKDDINDPPIPTVTLENVTLDEMQSYSFVYLQQEDSALFTIDVYVSGFDTMLLPFAERPNPSPSAGKALVRIVNVAVSTYDNPAMLLVLNGTGVASRELSLPFTQASDFLEYDAGVNLTFYTTLPVDGGSVDRSYSFVTVADSTVMIYIRGDIGPLSQLGTLETVVGWTYPGPPVAAPVAPPTAEEPMAEPATEGPVAPTAPTAPTAGPTRVPTTRVSSAAQSVVQVVCVASLAALLF